MEEELLTTESLLSSERFETADEMVALHVRMAISGEALDPKNKSLPEVTDKQLINLDKTVAAVANGSVVDRVNWWEKRWQKEVAKNSKLTKLSEQKKANKQYGIWVSDMIKDFSASGNQEKINRLKSKNIGEIDLSNFNQQTAKTICDQIYQRYFADQGQGDTVEVVVITKNGQETMYIPPSLNQFIDDVIKAYGGDYDKIVNDLDALEWYAGIFGSATKEELSGKTPKQVHANEVIKELIHTRIKLENEPKKQELVEQANETKKINGQPTTRPNWLNEKEELCLNWLNESKGLERRRIQKQPIQPVQREPTLVPKPKTLEQIPAEPRPPPKPSITLDELRESNIHATDVFITRLRDRSNWRSQIVGSTLSGPVEAWITVGNLSISKDREWFSVGGTGSADLEWTINGEAARRYQLPLAIYMPGDHGMLITKGPYQQPDGHWYINVWNPFYKGTQPIKLEKRYDDSQKNLANLINDHIYSNSLFIQQMAQPSENDLEALLDDPALQVFGDALKDEKLNERQKDVLNCLPYCLLIGGYLNALKPGRTPFKDQGITQFAQDFHVKILTREELLARLKSTEDVGAGAGTPIEAKSFADILQTTRQKVEAEEPIELHLDKAGLPSVIENIISAIELPIKITSPPKTDIDNQEGKVGTRLKIGAGPFQQEIDLSFNLINTADNKIVFSNIVSQPEEVFGTNVKEILEQQQLHGLLQQAIQKQSDQQRANIEIESVGLQFTEDDKLALTIRGKKR